MLIGFIVVTLAPSMGAASNASSSLHFLLWAPPVLVLSLVPLWLLKAALIALRYGNEAAEGRLDGLQ